MSLKLNPEVAAHYLRVIGTPEQNQMYEFPDDDGIQQKVFYGTLKEIAAQSSHEYKIKRIKEKELNIKSIARLELQNLESVLSSLYESKEIWETTIKSVEHSIRQIKLLKLKTK